MLRSNLFNFYIDDAPPTYVQIRISILVRIIVNCAANENSKAAFLLKLSSYGSHSFTIGRQES